LKLRIAVALVAILVLVGWWSSPPDLDSAGVAPDLPRDLDSWLRDREARVHERFGIVPGTEKRITWRGQPGVQTEYAVVYLHGFSATRAEIAPVPERIAASLNANLFESRLAGHGRETERLESVAAEAWLEDGLEALAIGAAIGRKVLLLGTSTGATLALALADHELFQAVDSLVLLSPNLGFDDPAADWLTRPYGPLIARATIGEYREFEPVNNEQARYWTTRYPTAALIEMLRLVELANANLDVASVPRALLVYSSKDIVVSPSKYLDAFQRLPATSKERHEVIETSDPAFHVLTGDILSPESVKPTVDRIVAFVRGAAGADPG
jgi:esterase/lipase